MFFLLFYCIFSTLAGNGVNVKDQLLLVPYPQNIQFNKGSTNGIEIDETLTMSLSTQCQNNPNCLSFMKFNFNHTITFPLQQQKNLRDFRISLHKAIDIPHIIPLKPNFIKKVHIIFKSSDEKIFYPSTIIGSDESYSLSISTSSIIIEAQTVYGARHALETLLQLIRPNGNTFVISQLPITITDSPRFKWRGLMVDLARNAISKLTLVKTINALASLKMNVLHLHLTDSQSFMFESSSFPELSKQGAFNQENVLNKPFIIQLLRYAALRGILIYPEIDIPGHTASWGLGYPGVTVDCWDYLTSNKILYAENRVSLNPTNETSFHIVQAVLKELAETFGSQYIHIGGDEVDNNCWLNSKEYPAIKEWMKKNNFDSITDVESYYNQIAQEEVIKQGAHPIVWEEVFKKGNAKKESTIIQVWSDIRQLKLAVDAGYKAIYSAGLYLDRQVPLCNNFDSSSCGQRYMWVWTTRDFYKHDPTKDFTDAELENVYGGEGCSWDESCNDENFFDRVFQRFSAIAERFWSNKNLIDDESHEVRANYLRCLGKRRGFLKGTGPLYTSYCDAK
ncbi:betahexosaminidase beta chain precursor, putative [Entamoeba histolytica KU27]|uniref:Beta-hexosaminidase n=1 Tax=Entamoeba histolytica KU27 TaxID=885311 RepID=M2QJ29_ENTHI|nr:betahexosaminidase beta chain precursor, putative [Entamoeba histolytica KU27]